MNNISKSEFKLLETYIRDFGSEINSEAIVKEDILRQGIRFEATPDTAFSGKSYFIFSFNIDNDKEVLNKKYPEEIAISGGPFDLKRTIISVRIHNSSPYVIKLVEDKNNGEIKPVLYLNENFIADVLFSEEKSYMSETTASGKSVRDLAPTIEW